MATHPAAEQIATAHLYAILDLGYIAPADLESHARAMCEGGADIIQLRAKNYSEHEIEEFADRAHAVISPSGIPFIINDHPALVPSVGAEGAHVGQDDFTVADARWRAGRSLSGEAPLPIIGRSTHSVDQAVAAAAEGADYIGFGPLFPTPTKAGRPAIGLGDVARVHELVSVPIFCIGGIKLENLDAIMSAGARRIVVVSGILQAADPAQYCRELKRRLVSKE